MFSQKNQGFSDSLLQAVRDAVAKGPAPRNPQEIEEAEKMVSMMNPATGKTHQARQVQGWQSKAADVKAEKKAKKDYDGDGKVETAKAEVWGSRAKAAKKAGNPFKTTMEAKMPGVAKGSMPGKQHMCATKLFHEQYGSGEPIHTQHAEPDAEGNIAWYDVMFEHGLERQVPTDSMTIVEAMMHGHSKKK